MCDFYSFHIDPLTLSLYFSSNIYSHPDNYYNCFGDKYISRIIEVEYTKSYLNVRNRRGFGEKSCEELRAYIYYYIKRLFPDWYDLDKFLESIVKDKLYTAKSKEEICNYLYYWPIDSKSLEKFIKFIRRNNYDAFKYLINKFIEDLAENGVTRNNRKISTILLNLGSVYYD